MLFAEDFAAAISSKLAVAVPSDAVESEHLNERADRSGLTHEQRELRKLAKRIVRAVKDQLKQALIAETELTRRPYTEAVQHMDDLLEQSLTRHENGSTTGDANEDDGGEGAEAQLNGEASAHHAAKANGLVNGDHAAEAKNTADDAAPPLPNGETGEVLVNGATTTSGESSSADSGDLLAPLSQGGVPWYMEAFDPNGTTVHDERWSGRELLRDMSEELSEMDDDDLADMVDGDEMLERANKEGEADANGDSDKLEVPRTKNGKRVKRWKGFR